MIGFIAIILLLAGAALGLAAWLPLWVSFMLVGSATLLTAVAFLVLARAQAQRCTLVPRRAMKSLQKHLAELGEQRV